MTGVTHPWPEVPVWTAYRSVSRPSNVDDTVLSLHRGLGVIVKGTVEGNHNRTPEDLSRYQSVRKHDIVVNRMKAWSGSAGLAPQDGIISAHYLVFEPTSEVLEPAFANWLLPSDLMVAQYRAASNGIRLGQIELSRTAFSQLKLPVPPRDVQRRVADFLDTETTRIDTLIAKNSRAMALAEEAFTHDLAGVLAVDGSRPFTPFDGPVPSGYRPLWLAGSTFSGKTLQGEQKDDHESEVPYLKASNVTSRGVDLDTVHTMWASSEEIDALAVRSGDVLVIEGGATAGRAALLEHAPAQPTILQNHVHCVRPSDGFDGEFLYWVLAAYYDSGYYDSYTSAVTFASFPSGKLRALPVPDLTLRQQRKVSAGLRERRADVDAAHARMRQFNDLLKERRQALITASVTGQLDI